MNPIKKIYALLGMALIGAFSSPVVNAQQMPKLPLDSEVRYGVLPNGLTYYIRHNEKPKGQVNFYIAQKVGSILEEENQRGLAHFLEHMCFNGTVNFPGNSLISYLESIGVKFGVDLNAYTGVDETVYRISNVPSQNEWVLDSCLLILHDWADGLLLEPVEIDKERGVIHEEWRRSMVGQMRILENVLPDIYPGSKYGHRLPIGLISVIDNFKPEEIREYYETWYRPDQQGIIVVGDINVDYIEQKIKEMFSSIEMPANPKERIYLKVDDNEGTLYAIGTDPEQANAIAELMFKNESIPDEYKGTQMEIITKYLTGIITSILNERLNDIASKPDAPFAQANVSYGNFFLAKTEDALSLDVLPKDGDVRPAIEAAYREILRAQRGGFTQSEYDRAKAKYLANIESAYNNRANVENDKYGQEYIRNFIDGTPAPGVEIEWQLAQGITPMLPLEAINQTMAEMVSPDNRVLLVLLPEGENYPVPVPDEMNQIFASVDAENIEAYKDEMREDPFIPNLPAPGKVVKEETLSQWDAQLLTLSNGVQVIVKPTTFKDDEVLISAIALGGTEKIDAADSASIIFMDVALSQLGFGEYTNSDVNKYLAGKKVKFNPSINVYTREASITTTPKDLTASFEIIYNYFTAANLNPDEFSSLVGSYSSVIANQEAQPQFQFMKKLYGALYSDPRQQMISKAIIDNASRERIEEMIHDFTKNAADYTFIVVGNVNLEELKPLLEQYVATLPADVNNKTQFAPNVANDIIVGPLEDNETLAMQTPQTWVGILATGAMDYTAKDRALISIAAQILSKRLIDTVREEMGAVYSISAGGSMRRPGINNVLIQSAFPMKPEMKDEVLEFIKGQFVDMTSNVSQEEFNKVIDYMVKTAVENKEKNETWSQQMQGWIINGVDTFNGDVEMLKSLTPADVQNAMKNLMDQNSYRVIVIDPAQ